MESADVNRWSGVLTTARLPVPAGPALVEWARASAARAERAWDEDVAHRFVLLAAAPHCRQPPSQQRAQRPDAPRAGVRPGRLRA